MGDTDIKAAADKATAAAKEKANTKSADGLKPGESPTDDPLDGHPIVRQARIDGTSVPVFVPGQSSPVPGIERDVLPEKSDKEVEAAAKEAAATREARSTTPTGAAAGSATAQARPQDQQLPGDRNK